MTSMKDKNLSPNGKNWLIMALDPNHDSQIDLAGYPDTNSAHTIVKKVVKEYQIGNGGALGNYDLHIFTLPELINGGTVVNPSFTTASYDPDDDQVTIFPTGPDLCRGPVCWSVANPGGDTTPSTYGAFAPVAWGCADFNDQLEDGATRVVGFAIEAINTTADIYRQGSVTCYEMPQFQEEDVCDYLSEALVSGSQNIVSLSRQPPSKVAEATILAGSTKWPASEGAYAPVYQYTLENDLKVPHHAMRVFKKNDSLTDFTVALSDVQKIKGEDPDFETYGKQTQEIPYNTKGIYFTGLSNQSTITLVVTMIIEIAPAYGNLVSLARPSPSLDWDALKTYSAIVPHIGVATKSKNNASGDWFRTITKLVAAVSPAVGAVFGPEGAAIGKAVSETAKILLPLIPEGKKKKKVSAQVSKKILSDSVKQITASRNKIDRSRK